MRISLSKDTSKSKPNEIFVNVEISEFDDTPEFKHSHSFKYIPSATDDKGTYGEIIVYKPVNSGEEPVNSEEEPVSSGEGNHISYIFNLEKCFNKKCKDKKEKKPEYVCSTISGKTNRLLVADVFHTTPRFNHLQEFGDALFKALFSHHALTVLKKTGPDLPNGGIYLHLNKHLVLDDIPWEYAKEGDTFLVQQRKFTRMYKCLEEPQTSQQNRRSSRQKQQRRCSLLLTLRKLPLRIVVVAPDPIISNGASMDLADLHLNDQWQVFVNEHSSNSKKIILENVYPPTVDKMDTLLKANSEVAPVLHFMGHCVAKGDKRKLVFEDSKTGELEYVDALLPTIPENLPLAFLSACNAREVARGLLERGTLYTIGSYCPIPDDLARKFESKFYQLLANGMTIEKAMWRARVFFSEKSDKKDDRENYYFPGAMILYSSTFHEADGTFECEDGMPIIEYHMPSNNLASIPSASPFYGRKSELLSLITSLREMATRNKQACQMCTIVGIGGQGKTALAMEAVRRAAHLFTGGIFAWQFDSTAISFSEYLRHLANVIFPNYWEEGDYTNRDLASSIVQKFVKHPSCLLILDHADTLKSAYRQNDKDATELISWLTKLTSNSAVKILATSHESLGWLKEYEIYLKGFTNDIDSGRELFFQHLTTEAKEKKQLKKQPLRDLVTCMDGHPLSLVLLGRAASQQQHFGKSLEDIIHGHYDTMLADEDAKEKFKKHFEPMINSLKPKNRILLYMCSLFTGPITAEVLAFFSYFIDCDRESTKNNYDIADIEQILDQLHSCELIIKNDREYRIHVGSRQGIRQHNTLLKPSLNLPTQNKRDEVYLFGIVKSSEHDNARSKAKLFIRYYSIGNTNLQKIDIPDVVNRNILKKTVRRQPPFLRLNVFIFEASETSNDFPRSCAKWISEVEEKGLPFILCSDKTVFSQLKEVAKELRENLKETHWIIMTDIPPDPIENPSSNQPITSEDNLLLTCLQTDIKENFYDVPAPNGAFTGRFEILKDMETKLKSSDPNGRRILALTGLGGMGKTQIMLRYCYLHREEYDFIFWLEMDGWSTATDSFRRLAINLGHDEKSTKGKDFETLIGWVRAWLEKKKKRWLLLLASVDDDEISKKMFDLLPRFGGDVILTTRRANLRGKAIVITVQKMEQSEALQLLLGEELTEKSDKTIQDAREIVDKLGCMPLAISLARAYIDNQGTLEDYLEKFKKKSGESLLNYSSDQDKYTVGTVWLVSFDRIQAINPRAIHILEDCAFLHPDGIPANLFEKIYSNPKDTSTSSTSPANEHNTEQSINPAQTVQAAIEVLKQYSFLTQTRKELEGGKDNPQNNVLSIQRLVQTVIYDTISAERKPDLVGKIVTALNQETKFSRRDSVAQTLEVQRIMNAYLPHIRQLATSSIQKEVTSKEFDKVLTRGVHYLLTNRMYSGLEELAQSSIKLSKTIYGSEHGNTATALNNLALLYEGQGNYNAAQMLLEDVLQIRENILGLEHAGTVMAMNNLASVYKNQGAFEKAEINFTKALNIRKRSEKEKGREKDRERDIATSLNNLAGLYKTQGKYSEAESLYREALEIYEKEFGPEHLETATSLNNLAGIYFRQGKYEKSEGPQLKALAIRRKELGPDHVDTARTTNNLAGLYRSQGKYKEAKPLHQKALTICQTVLGPEYPDTATCLNNVAKLHELQGNYTEAGPLYEKALEIRKKVLGLTDVVTAESLHNLAAFYQIMGKYREAEDLHVEALAIREKILGSEHPEAAESRNSLAVIYEIQGNYEKAEQWNQQALDIRENVLGEEHPDTAESLNNRARLYNNMGMYTEAEPLYTRALAIRKKVLGLNHPDTATSLNDQALLYINQSKVHNDPAKLQKAKLLAEQALTFREIALGSEHPVIASSLNNLALFYERDGRLDEAKRQYERVLAILEKVFKPEHPEHPKLVETSKRLLSVQKLLSFQGKHKGQQLQSQEITGIIAFCNLVPALVQILGFSRKTITS